MDPLMLPLGAFARSVEPLNAEDSLDRAATFMRGATTNIIPVVDNGHFVGAVTEKALYRALAEGLPAMTAISEIVEQVRTLQASASGAEALREFEDNPEPIVVIDPSGQPIGVVSASDLFARRFHTPVPPMVGGMATPFGVYLTNGTVSGGASHWALAATGSLLFLLFLGSSLLTISIAPRLPQEPWAETLVGVLPVVIFLVTMRLIPLSGIHAAEHKVVHALERGEILTPEVVDRMPRVHPRCGTNLAAGMAIFLGLSESDWHPDHSLRVMVGALATLFLYKPLGSFLQLAVTTRPPSKKQLESGIFAAKDLLQKYQSNRRISSNPFQRILNSGMLHVIAGSMLTAGVAYLLSEWLHFPLP